MNYIYWEIDVVLLNLDFHFHLDREKLHPYCYLLNRRYLQWRPRCRRHLQQHHRHFSPTVVLWNEFEMTLSTVFFGLSTLKIRINLRFQIVYDFVMRLIRNYAFYIRRATTTAMRISMAMNRMNFFLVMCMRMLCRWIWVNKRSQCLILVMLLTRWYRFSAHEQNNHNIATPHMKIKAQTQHYANASAIAGRAAKQKFKLRNLSFWFECGMSANMLQSISKRGRQQLEIATLSTTQNTQHLVTVQTTWIRKHRLWKNIRFSFYRIHVSSSLQFQFHWNLCWTTTYTILYYTFQFILRNVGRMNCLIN